MLLIFLKLGLRFHDNNYYIFLSGRRSNIHLTITVRPRVVVLIVKESDFRILLEFLTICA